MFKFLNDSEIIYNYDPQGNKATRREISDISLAWGNTVGSLNWEYEINDKLSLSNKLYYSGSLSGSRYRDESYEDNVSEISGIDYSSDVHTIGLRSDLHHHLNENHILRYGSALQTHIYRPNFTAVIEETNGISSFKYYPYADSLKYNTVDFSIYAEDEIAVTDAFSVNAGLRYSLCASGGKVWNSLEPRLAMKYTFNNVLTAKASYTEMSQTSHLVSSLYLDLPTNMWLPSTERIRPSRSREVAAGLYSNISPMVHLNVEGWYKHMYNLIEYAGAYTIFPPLSDWEYGYKAGQGRSWGAELDFGYSNGKTEANVYYTLSWSQRKFDDFYRGWYSDRNDNRHKLTLMA